jgi:DNA repair exonuclease SbcCD ATPase subunit
MAKNREQIMKELEALKGEVQELKDLPTKEALREPEEEVSVLMKYMIEERERTNKKLEDINEKILRLKNAVETMYSMSDETEHEHVEAGSKEVALSGLDTAVLDFIQSRGMACADDLREFMKYKGRNGASTRLNRLYTKGLLERHQLGHKVYYRYAGKATNTLIISPPQ